jgi:hypothetical protein
MGFRHSASKTRVNALTVNPSYEKRRLKKRTRAQQRAAGTKKTALFDIVNRN